MPFNNIYDMSTMLWRNDVSRSHDNYYYIKKCVYFFHWQYKYTLEKEVIFPNPKYSKEFLK